ncbi:ABC transporter ATP-binding protein [Candidatus Woesearchaeota archaeon]|nr:ABC transporter ATP-binding protein [Candidatus Woesearchaeota archaeon]MBT5215958.1 ABC transporter ATP-binding protein [Candidatus Woesearchaeota archaeon]MBT6402330.1 ABC transporter ATP-binding protein [Candidatus Woesearchaeota archaeon]
MGIFELKGVTKRFKDNLVLENLNLDIPQGSIFGILGINGSGKTTILRLLVGYYKPTKGEVLYLNKKLKKVEGKLRSEIGFTTQDSAFYPKLTVEENIKYFGALYGLPKKTIESNSDRILKLVELDHVRNRIAEQLSGGMQRRLDMACSLIHVPKVVILDEPTEDLDPLLRKDILHLIKKIAEIGTTVIITSHRLEDIEIVCDRVAILHNKSMIRSGTLDELKEEYSSSEEIHLQTKNQDYRTIVKNISQYDTYYVDGSRLVIRAKNAERILHEILHIIENTKDKLIYVDVQRPTLEEVFQSLTKDVGAQKDFLRKQ